MKKIAFGQTIGILQTEAGYKLLQSRIAIRNRIIDQSNFTQLLVKVSSRQPLTATEEIEISAFLDLNFLEWQWQHQEYLEGRIDESNVPTVGLRRIFTGQSIGNIPRSGWLTRWDSFKAILAPDYVNWMEENVIGEC
ncbi:MAG: hypothetical protein ACI9ON_002351 [Limisphaerales bacterium]|jgi:hypothetical protein